MKRLMAILAAVLLTIGTAVAEYRELAGYPGGDPAEIAEAEDLMIETENGRTCVRNCTGTIYVTTKPDEQGIDRIDRISIQDIDNGCCICGIAVGMTFEEANELLANGFELEKEENGVRVYRDSESGRCAEVSIAEGLVTKVSIY